MGQHFTFNGLVTRKQFWLNQLAVTLIMFASLAVGIGGAAAATTEAAAIFALFVMAVPIIGSAVSAWSYLARRVRDTGNSAWLALLVAIPYVGIVPWLYFGLTSKSITNNTGMEE